MWAYETNSYQIYTLGFCGAPFENDGKLEHRILKVLDWIPHLEKLGVGAVLFNPVFESDTHGYNTRDYRKIDTRLGTNEDFKKICRYKCQVPFSRGSSKHRLPFHKGPAPVESNAG